MSSMTRRDQLAVTRQHMDRYGPLPRLAPDDRRRLVVAEQNDERPALYVLDEPVAQYSKIIAEALEVPGRERRPVGRPSDFAPSRGGHCREGAAIFPIGIWLDTRTIWVKTGASDPREARFAAARASVN